MSEYLDNMARALVGLLINEYPNILREELDKVGIDPDVISSWGQIEVDEKCQIP